MIKAVLIDATDTTPQIKFDVENNIFELKGESRPENAQKFYLPVFEFMDQFTKYLETQKPTKKIVFKFYLEYLNSTSSKFLMSLMTRIEKIKKIGADVEVQWEYDYLDTDMKELGDEFSNLLTVPFNFVSVQ